MRYVIAGIVIACVVFVIAALVGAAFNALIYVLFF